jgi:SOS response regulatory protein OraA/RecX
LKKPSPLLNYPEAQRYTLGLLSRRDRTYFELSAKLSQRSVPTEIQAQLLDWLASKGWVNDERSAESFTASRKGMGWGPSKIRVGLLKRGIAKTLIDQTLREHFGKDEEGECALHLLRGKKSFFRDSNPDNSNKRPQKALAFLVRRGFSYGYARLAVQKVFGYNSDLPEEE